MFSYAPISRKLVMLTKEASPQEAPQYMRLRLSSYLRRSLLRREDNIGCSCCVILQYLLTVSTSFYIAFF